MQNQQVRAATDVACPHCLRPLPTTPPGGTRSNSHLTTPVETYPHANSRVAADIESAQAQLPQSRLVQWINSANDFRLRHPRIENCALALFLIALIGFAIWGMVYAFQHPPNTENGFSLGTA